ncbi:hypothetical protein [Streptomyces ipomoeae]|uniref:hypothetical protein n=1 Tax=Streptomyces ipomoeae TaxID=103232 RepID=UPI001146D3F8|nr:hypothetical protein [Streptomyces ipomoeae]TQE33147.1 hypothetical protein Sipo7851_21890 [Streptomyces ipomoeae]
MTHLPPAAHAEAVEAMVFAARRMQLPLSTRQAATLLKVVEDKLLPADQQLDSDRSDWPHGTIAGYKRHLRAKERACEACREACRLHSAARRRKRPRRRELQPCGTLAAYHRHLRRFETPCAHCKKAKRAYQRDYRARLKTKRAHQHNHRARQSAAA